MAYSAEQWERTKAYFESGQYSLSEISDKTGIGKSAISKASKNQQWKSGKNADYIEAKKTLAIKKSTENQQTLQILDDIADEQIRNKELVYGVTQSALKQLKEISDNGVKEVLVTSKVGGDTIIKKETINLTPQDYESIINAADKASLTMRINDRHAPKQDINVQANAMAIAQNKKTLSDFYDETDS